MTQLRLSKLKIKGADLPRESSLPFVKTMGNVQQKTRSILDEDDELFVGYGFVNSAFPHKQLDDYTTELKDQAFDSVELENDYLKATFVPCLGGRLWSLFDKKANRELLFANKVFRPGNLSARNAWFAGGVEWNCGIVGHHPYTCSQVHTASLKMPDGTPVLRIYEFDRIRHTTWQVDFFLPEGSRLLLCRMRIYNPLDEVVPMYWWSNIAVDEIKNGRIVVDADESYTNRGNMVSKTTIPISQEIDVTYPANNPGSIDFFFKIENDKRKYICNFDTDGYGLVQTSTKRLQGRKLFVWGQTVGSAAWQSLLAGGDESAKYAEIQAGLAHTQYECIPMPPKTAWEWMEGYGAMKAEPNEIYGEWKNARAEVSKRLDEIVSEEYLETLLKQTHDTVGVKKADEILFVGSGWGGLENLRRKSLDLPMISAHLDFSCVGAEQKPWESLVQKHMMDKPSPQEVPLSWQGHPEWIKLMEESLEKDTDNWYLRLQLGVACFAKGDFSRAQELLISSVELTESCWAYYVLSQLAKVRGEIESTVNYIMKAIKLRPFDISLVKEAAETLLWAEKYDELIDYVKSLPNELAQMGRVRLQLIRAYIKIGDLKSAQELFSSENPLEIADMREGETSITDLWLDIEELKAKKQNQSFDRDTAIPPKNLEYRTSNKKKK